VARVQIATEPTDLPRSRIGRDDHGEPEPRFVRKAGHRVCEVSLKQLTVGRGPSRTRRPRRVWKTACEKEPVVIALDEGDGGQMPEAFTGIRQRRRGELRAAPAEHLSRPAPVLGPDPALGHVEREGGGNQVALAGTGRPATPLVLKRFDGLAFIDLGREGSRLSGVASHVTLE